MATKGKAIYRPQGKAGEYSEWACNFYTGCSNNCQYCYCKRGVQSHVWSTEPSLKKCFKNERDAISVFRKELAANLDELRDKGIFFSFSTDPMIPGKTLELTLEAASYAIAEKVPVQILTKRVDWVEDEAWKESILPTKDSYKDYIAFGFTITGCDELEPYASPNMERIKTMLDLHMAGYKTFASVEPVIKVDASWAMINVISGWCDLIKVGLLSGKKEYGKEGVEFLFEMIKADVRGSKFYLKDSFIDLLGIDRGTLPDHCVDSSYNIFKSI